MKMVLDRANALLQKADLAKEVAELVTLVDDWKGHQLSHFGDLVLSGTFPVVKGESSKDSQRDVRPTSFLSTPADGGQYKIFLFERILLCCKEINPNKTKNRLQGKSGTTKQGKAKLQLKGRIFIQNICDVVQLQPAQNGSRK
jgi:cell division control protein 24